MKNKLLVCVLCASIVLFCCSCGFFGPQKYICEVDNVKQIQIIQLDRYVEGEYRYEYTVLAQITDVQAFVEQLNSIEHSVNWGEPSVLYTGYIIIRVEYLNGDVDELYSNAQCFSRDGTTNGGFFFFNKEQFDSLIDTYLEIEANSQR